MKFMDKQTSGVKLTENKSPMSRMILGNAYILGAILLFATNIPVVKIMIPQWMDANGVTVVRIIGGAILFWIASLFVKKDLIEKADFLKIFLGGGVTVFFFAYLLNIALKYGNPIDVSIIMTLPPIYVIIYQIIFKHMKPSWLEVVGMLIAFAGAIIVIASGHETKHAPNPLLGDFFAILCGLSYMAYLLILEKPTHKYRPIPMLKWVFLGACIPCVLICCWKVGDAPILHADAGFMPWFWVGFLALGPSFLAYLFVNPAIKMIGSELVAIYQYFMPVATTIISVFLGEAKFQWIEGLAIAVIIVGMFLTDYGNHRHKQKLMKVNSNNQNNNENN